MIGTDPHTQGGISTVVNVLRDAGLFDRCGIEYIATHRDGDRRAKLAQLVANWPRFMARLLTGRIALLHSHTSSRASFWRKCLFIVPALLVRVPVVLHLHGAEFQVFYNQECSSPTRRFIRGVFERVSRVVVLSESWGQWVGAEFPAARVSVIVNPVHLPLLAASGQRKDGALLFLGRLGRRKGVYDLLHAVANVVPRNPGLRVLLGGDGELEEVQAQAQSLGIGQHVELLGWVRGEDKLRLLGEAGVYVLPSYHEGLPMSVLEAMAHGMPVVSTPVGGIPEAVRDGVEGFLVAPGDVVALSDRLERLLADPGLRGSMGAAARRRAESEFGVAGIVERWVELYRELGVACDRA